MKIKTRFAPSPTGYLHIGGIRTALYSWLFARNLGGKFILRIEDTDLKRSSQSAINDIINSMNWLKLDWDDGPFFQSRRFSRYSEVIDYMLLHGTAYKCYCARERLEMLRNTQIMSGNKPRYDGYCRHSHHQVIDKPHVVRFSNPQDGSVVFNDLIRGTIEVSNLELDDFIIRRSDGTPTYNFCVVVDDYDMEITHVIRGDDHINNTSRQINLFKALGAKIPEYAHISMIIDNNGKKLSKRHGALRIMQYRNDGFLPEALLNHVVRLGWSHGDKEIFSIDEMKRLFNLTTISKSASMFNAEKLLWLNHHYIKHLPVDYIAMHLSWHIKQQGIDTSIGPQLSELIKLFNKRCKTLKEIAVNSRYFYEDFSVFDTDIANKYLRSTSILALQTTRSKLATLDKWIPSSINTAIKQTAQELKVDISKIGMPLRVAVTGTDKSPALDVTIYTIGRLRSLNRIDLALKFIANQAY